MSRPFMVIALLLAILAADACAAPAAPTQAPPTSTPQPQEPTQAQPTAEPPTPTSTPEVTGTIKGNISDVQPAEGGDSRLGTARIEGEKIEGNTYDKAVLTVAADTAIYRQTGDELVPATFADLAFGQTVSAEIVGPVKESYPVQGKAGKIVIVFEAPRN